MILLTSLSVHRWRTMQIVLRHTISAVPDPTGYYTHPSHDRLHNRINHISSRCTLETEKSASPLATSSESQKAAAAASLLSSLALLAAAAQSTKNAS